MAEAELHILRARLEGGIRNKAARGELRRGLPVGFVWGDEDGEVRFHPDESVVSTVRTVFSKFTELGSVRKVWLWFCSEGLPFPLRSHMKSDIRWVAPSYHTIHQVLTNPVYAGAYAPSAFKNAVDLILRLCQDLAADLSEVENQDRKGGARIFLSCERASGKCQGQGYQYTRHPQTLAESVAGTGCSPRGLRSTILTYSCHAVLPAGCRARGQRLPEHRLTQWMEASSSIKRKLQADKSVTLSNHES